MEDISHSLVEEEEIAEEEETVEEDETVEEEEIAEEEETVEEEEAMEGTSFLAGLDSVSDVSRDKISIPEIGMQFTTSEEAQKFYNDYAFEVGFSVRKHLVRRNKFNIPTWRVFTCSRQGQTPARPPSKSLPKFQRLEHRIGCNAHMEIKICKEGIYKVTSFDPMHNHDTTTPTKTQLMYSHKEINEGQKAMGDLADAAGIRPKETYELLAKQSGGRRHLTFLPDDYKNYLRTKRQKDMAFGDAGALMQYLQNRQNADPSFYYAVQVDKDDQISNIFWADRRSLLDYEYFGDVICFDTTYKTNSYGRPFAPFVGVNHHKQTVIFGAALLYDESTPSFVWLFQTFLAATGGKAPKVILTDQDKAMSSAIPKVFPNTTHRLCVWHMYQNAAKHLSHVFSGSKSFKSDFGRCVYDYEDEEQFLSAWKDMLKNYNLSENKWLAELFKIKEKWALVYGRQFFCADMKSTPRSESINSVIKKHLDPRQRLLDFFNHWEKLLEDRRHKEMVADLMASKGHPQAPFSEMLKQAARIYTPSVYKIFEGEYGQFLNCSIQDNGQSESVHEYLVTNGRRMCFVRHDLLEDNMMCSCHKFEFMGIQCCHVIKVLDFMNIKLLPEKYFLRRWRKDAKAGKKVVVPDAEIEPGVNLAKRYSQLMRLFNDILCMASQGEKAYQWCVQNAGVFQSKVEELLIEEKGSCQTINNQALMNEQGAASKQPSGILKKDGGRGRRPYKSSLQSNTKQRKTNAASERSEASAGSNSGMQI